MFVYPVSAVMKFWHWLLAEQFNIPANATWIASVILLVFTVRGIILPFAWQTYKTARTTYLMRPHLEALKKQYGESVTPEELRAEDEERKRIQKEHGYNPLAACVPALIQIPVFLGLYRLLLWMAVPDAAGGRSLGVLSEPEIESFRSAVLFGVPLPAYVSMSDEQFEFLGTTQHDVRTLAIPLIATAIVLTSTNLLVNQLRNRATLEWENTMTRQTYYMLYWLIPIVAGALLTAGLTGLVPIALLMYWVCNNLFTTLQTAAFSVLIVRRYPSEEIHHRSQAEAKAAVDTRKRENKERKLALRRKRLTAITRPQSFNEIRREIKAEKQARKDAKAAEKADKKALTKERNQARKELNRQIMAERKAAKEAKKAGKAGQAGKDEAPTIAGSTRRTPPAAPGSAKS